MQKKPIDEMPVVKFRRRQEEPWVKEVFGKPMHPDRPCTRADIEREQRRRRSRTTKK